MADVTYEKDITGLVVIDPYNDFISEGGKVWDRLKGVAEANECVPHMLDVLNAARRAGIRVFYALHHRYRPGDYETWKYIAPIQRAAWSRTMVKDATADYSDEEMHAALDINIPNYATAAMTTDEVVQAISLLASTNE
jgi:nicotinamidase-related amidase